MDAVWWCRRRWGAGIVIENIKNRKSAAGGGQLKGYRRSTRMNADDARFALLRAGPPPHHAKCARVGDPGLRRKEKVFFCAFRHG